MGVRDVGWRDLRESLEGVQSGERERCEGRRLPLNRRRQGVPPGLLPARRETAGCYDVRLAIEDEPLGDCQRHTGTESIGGIREELVAFGRGIQLPLPGKRLRREVVACRQAMLRPLYAEGDSGSDAGDQVRRSVAAQKKEVVVVLFGDRDGWGQHEPSRLGRRIEEIRSQKRGWGDSERSSPWQRLLGCASGGRLLWSGGYRRLPGRRRLGARRCRVRGPLPRGS